LIEGGMMSGDKPVVRLVLCRHTQTDDNVERRYTGQSDVPLNSIGVIQARLLALRIAEEFHVRRIVSSDLLRARTVSQFIAAACEASVMMDARLREVAVGQMTGLSRSVGHARFPFSKYRSSNSMYDYRDIGGEDAFEVSHRHRSAIDEHSLRLSADYPHELPTLVVVGHATALRTLFIDRLHTFEKIHDQGDFQVCEWFIQPIP
jgi:broad specificity phosphatase PhoE